MPPKKTAPTKRASTKKSAPDVSKDEAKQENQEASIDAKEEPNAEEQSGNNAATEQKKTASKKRKKEGDVKEEAPAEKASRRSRRPAPGSERPNPSKEQLLNYLLSQDCDELLRPEDEKEDIQKRGQIKTYSTTVLNVFEELMSAIILSRPINHRLGLRTIRTVLNDPYNFTCAKAIKDAGPEKTHQAMWDAHTQHKGKTAEQLSIVADVVLTKFSAKDDTKGQHVQKVLADNDDDPEQALDALKKEIKGFGDTGSKIFLRRVQWLWPKAFPFVDNVSWKGLKALGLPEEAEPLHKLLSEHWKELDTAHLSVDSKDQEKLKRRAFVVLVERATSAELENKTHQILTAAAAAK